MYPTIDGDNNTFVRATLPILLYNALANFIFFVRILDEKFVQPIGQNFFDFIKHDLRQC